MNNTPNLSIEHLQSDMCHMLDLPGDRQECAQGNISVCVQCNIPGKFFTGETMMAFTSTGHVLCLLMGILTLAAGLIGMFTNFVIIAVLRKRKKYQQLDFLLRVLAFLDFYACAAALVSQLARMAFYGDWVTKGYASLHWYMFSTNAALFGRSTSLNMALLITVERFLAITFPFQSRGWFTASRATLLSTGVFCISIMLNVPRFFSYKVTPNGYTGENKIASLENFEYIIRTTGGYDFFYKTLGNIHGKIAFWVPWPLLIIFNVLSIFQADTLAKRRESMNRARRKDIEGLQLFLPVVIALVLSNVAPFTHFLVIRFDKTLYRELSTAMILSIALNSAVNFHIYYYRNATFKRESRSLLLKWIGRDAEIESPTRPEKSHSTDTL